MAGHWKRRQLFALLVLLMCVVCLSFLAGRMTVTCPHRAAAAIGLPPVLSVFVPDHVMPRWQGPFKRARRHGIEIEIMNQDNVRKVNGSKVIQFDQAWCRRAHLLIPNSLEPAKYAREVCGPAKVAAPPYEVARVSHTAVTAGRFKL